MQLARQEAAFLRHRSFQAQRVQAQVVHRAGQLQRQRFKQCTFVVGQFDLGVEEQVHLAHQPFVQADRHRHCGLEAGACAVVLALRLHGADRDHAGAGYGLR